MIIELKTIQDVKDFVEISSKYHNSEIVIKQNRYRVDGTSILGIFSLNLLEPVVVIVDSENDNDKIAFYNEIQQWKIQTAEDILNNISDDNIYIGDNIGEYS